MMSSFCNTCILICLQHYRVKSHFLQILKFMYIYKGSHFWLRYIEKHILFPYCNTATLYWSACTEPGKWALMYIICVLAVSILPVSTILELYFFNCTDSVVIFVLFYYMVKIFKQLFFFLLIVFSNNFTK